MTRRTNTIKMQWARLDALRNQQRIEPSKRLTQIERGLVEEIAQMITGGTMN